MFVTKFPRYSKTERFFFYLAWKCTLSNFFFPYSSVLNGIVKMFITIIELLIKQRKDPVPRMAVWLVG